MNKQHHYQKQSSIKMIDDWPFLYTCAFRLFVIACVVIFEGSYLFSQPPAKKATSKKTPSYVAELKKLDTNNDQFLTKQEFLAKMSKGQRPQSSRYFIVFDLDADQKLSFNEYLNIVSPSQRTLPHPIAERVDKQIHVFESRWNKWDTDSDTNLNRAEFSASNLSRSIPGLALTKWENWDRNNDDTLDKKEAAQVLEIAYGLCYPTGELLWEPSGRVLTGMLFDYVDKDGNYFIDLKEAQLAKFGFGDNTQTPALFKKMDQDNNGKLTMAEWGSDATHWTDPVGIFLAADKNLDGHLSRKELLEGTTPWQLPITEYLFPGFDLDGDNTLSFSEYRETPFANMALTWQALRTDRDNDGYLSMIEFQWDKGLFGVALAQVYFQRFDINQDEKLSLKEFLFNTTQQTPEYYEIEFTKRDADRNKQLTLAEYLGTLEGKQQKQARREFYHWDNNSDQLLSLKEFSERQAPNQPIPLNEFRYHDSDNDQHLSQPEYLAIIRKTPQQKAGRDFRVFDLNDDRKLTFEEYQSIISREQRKLPAPFMDHISQHMQAIKMNWKKWDANNDSKLDQDEYSSSNLSRSISRLTLTKWEDWDRNGDNALDQAEAKQALEIAYGLRYPTGELLWAPSGLMISGMLFDYVDKNGDHLIDLKEAKLAKFGFGDNSQIPTLFKKMDQDSDGKLTMAEWKSDLTHWIDPVGSFLAFDKDFDGHLSREELLSGTPFWQLPVTEFLFPGFDLDGDNALSFYEYRETPFANLALIWQELRTDRDNDGYLSIMEFQWDKGLFGVALTQEYFQRFDINRDDKLSLKEFIFHTTKRTPEYSVNEFKKKDADQNRQLTLAEYLGKLKGEQQKQARREFYHWDHNIDEQLSLQEFINRQAPKQPIFLNEFHFLDTDHNQLLTKNEFLATVPKEQQSQALRDFTVFDLQDDETLSYEEYLNIHSRDHRKLDHPIMHRVTKHMQDLEVSWNKWDINSDSKLSQEEFSSSNLSRSIPGLALTKWEDWDRNGDHSLDQSEAKQVLEIAYGLRYPTGELLWAPSGLMISGMLFDYVDKNGDHLIDLEEAKLAKFGFLDNTQTPELFKQMDQNNNETLTMAEWKSHISHWIDPVGTFLVADKDLNGHLNQEELLTGTQSWQLTVTEFLFPGFDLDGDNVLSLREYRETPFSNLAQPWQTTLSDRDDDGYMDLSEFQWGDGLFAATLTVEYFQRFDVNQDGKLSMDEFTFRVNQAKAPLEIVFRLRDRDQNGLISFEEILEDLKLPENANEKQKLHYETTLIRIEDAFRRADRNQDNSLDQAEFQSEEAREVVAPHLVVKKKNFSSSRVSRSSLSKKTEGDGGMWVILALNVLLLAGVLVFLVKKTKLFTR